MWRWHRFKHVSMRHRCISLKPKFSWPKTEEGKEVLNLREKIASELRKNPWAIKSLIWAISKIFETRLILAVLVAFWELFTTSPFGIWLRGKNLLGYLRHHTMLLFSIWTFLAQKETDGSVFVFVSYQKFVSSGHSENLTVLG